MQPPRHLLGSPRQHAAVRRIVLDDGAERCVRALSFSTGGGLDFWVLCDRAFDIGPLWWRGTQLAWQSPAGFPAPDLTERWDDSGRGMERGFSGMLLTCGLEHMRTPAEGAPLHGHLPYTPGRLRAYGEAWHSEEPLLSCEGEMVQYRLGGEGLRLVRRIEAPIRGNELRIHDTLENIGPGPQPIAMLYHVNPGYPLVTDGTVAILDGRRIHELVGGGLGSPDHHEILGWHKIDAAGRHSPVPQPKPAKPEPNRRISTSAVRANFGWSADSHPPKRSRMSGCRA